MSHFRRNRTQAERSIIFLGAIAGDTREDINVRLASVGARPLVQSSYRQLRKSYVPYFLADPTRLQRAVVHPPTWTDLRKAMR